MLERTLLLVKFLCDSLRKKVLQFLQENGFMIIAQRTIKFSPELAAEFYKDEECSRNFAHKVGTLSKAPVKAYVLAKNDAISDLLCLVSSNLWCRPFSVDHNFHVSQNRLRADKEIHFIFPNLIIEPICDCEGEEIYEYRNLTTNLIGGIYDIVEVCCSMKEPKTYLSNFLADHNANIPKVSLACDPSPQWTQMVAKEEQVPTKEQDSSSITTLSKRSMSSSSECKGKSKSKSSEFTSTTSCITCSSFSESPYDSEVFVKSENLSAKPPPECPKPAKEKNECCGKF